MYMSMCVCVWEQQRGWEAYIVKNEGLVTVDWFSLDVGFYGGGMKKGNSGGKGRKAEMKRACNVASHNTLLTLNIPFNPLFVTGTTS